MNKLKPLLYILLLTSVITVKAQKTADFTDPRDNETYKTVKIGEQTWMAENLAYLPKVSPLGEGSETEPYYYVYDYEDTNTAEAKATDNYKTYGALYNWTAAIRACPKGWHLPSDDEWDKLITYISRDKNTGSYYEYEDCYWTEIGSILKSKTGWNEDGYGEDGNGTDDYGFSAVPGGYRYDDGTFNYVGTTGGWWGSTQGNIRIYASTLVLYYNFSSVSRNYVRKEVGRSVRCLRDF